MIWHYQPILLVTILTALVHSEEDPDLFLTVQTIYSHLKDGEPSFLLCHPTNDKPLDFRFVRFQDTGQGIGLSNESYVDTVESLPNTLVLYLASKNQYDKFGAYACENNVTRVTTFAIPEPTPQLDLSTSRTHITANIGEEVKFDVARTDDYLPLLWRHNNTEKPAWTNKTTLTIPSVRPSDAGIYETYFDGQREYGIHILIQLMVRLCKAGKWGSQCDDDCPQCFNGGICHDVHGKCVCPPGFDGDNCEIPCQGNHFGKGCKKVCDSDEGRFDPKGACSAYTFCLPSPYGCSCGSGFNGPLCMDDCESGYYGASCTQECHCKNGPEKCDRITGNCSEGCLPGWTGLSCQMITNVTDCPPGTFGESFCKQKCHCANDEKCDSATGKCPTTCQNNWGGDSCSECIAGWFGPDCDRECHCLQPCNTTTGYCGGECFSGYIEDDCQTECPIGKYGPNCTLICACENGGRCEPVNGTCECVSKWKGPLCNETSLVILSMEPQDANVGQEVNVTCVIEGSPVESAQIWSLDVPGLTTSVNFDTNVTVASSQFTSDTVKNFTLNCTARNEHGLDATEIEFYVVDPPTLLSPPDIKKFDATHVEFQWTPWTFGKDAGGKENDTVEYASILLDYQNFTLIASNWSTNVQTPKFASLTPGADYQLAIKCRRHGPGGTGNLSPTAVFTTSCLFPNNSTVLPNTLTEDEIGTNHIVVQWEIPKHEEIGCKLQNFRVHYWVKDDPNIAQQKEHDPLFDNIHLADLETNTEYVIQISVIADNQTVGTPATINVKTVNTGIGPVQNLQSKFTTGRRAMLSWTEPVGTAVSDIESYNVTIILKEIIQCGPPTSYDDRNTVRQTTKANYLTINNLQPYTKYEIVVEAKTSRGWSESANMSLKTEEEAPLQAPGDLRVSVVSPGNWTFQWRKIPCFSMNGNLIFYEYAITKDDTSNLNPKTWHTDPTRVQDTEITLNDLEDDHDYNFFVRAHTRKGPGKWAHVVVNAVREAETFNKPGEINLTQATPTTLKFTWQKPALSKEPAIEYTIQYELVSSDGDAVNGSISEVITLNDTSDLSCHIESLLPSSVYEIQISAIYSKGESEPVKANLSTLAINVENTTIAFNKPEEIKLTQATPTTLEFTWQKPALSKEPEIGYKIQYELVSSDGDAVNGSISEEITLNDTSDLSCHLESLLPSSVYEIQISAIYSKGESEPVKANLSTLVAINVENTTIAFNKPEEIKLTQATPTTLEFTWRKPALSKEPERGYKIQYDLLSSDGVAVNGSISEEITLNDTSDLSCHLESLLPSSVYEIQISAIYSKGESEPVKANLSTLAINVENTTIAFNKPEEIKLTQATPTTLEFTWQKPALSKEPERGYKIQYELVSPDGDAVNGSSRVLILNDTSDLSYHLGSLLASSVYEIQISAIYSKGESEPVKANLSTLAIIEQNTTIAFNKPEEIKLTQATSTTLEFTWTQPLLTNELVIAYHIHYALLSSTEDVKIGSSSDVITLNDTSNLSHRLVSLVPSSLYKIQVTTVYPTGESEPIEANFTTSPDSQDKTIVLQLPPAPILRKNGDKSGTRLLEIQPSVDHENVRAYQVIVEDTSNNNKIKEEELQDFGSSSGQNATVYITAEIKADKIVVGGYNFTVGDNREYNGYRNAKLESQREYRIFVRTVGTSNKVYSGLSSAVFEIDNDPRIAILPPPRHIQLISASSTALEFKWLEPLLINELIIAYKIKYELVTSYEGGKVGKTHGILDFNDTTNLSYRLESLVPSSKYEIEICAVYPSGTSLPAWEYLLTLDDVINNDTVVPPQLPPPPTIRFDEESKQWVITIYPVTDNETIRAYQVVVEDKSSNATVTEENLREFNAETDANSYIAGEIDASEIPPEGYNFTVGDGMDYEGYHNVELKPDTKYRVYVRTVGNDDNKFSPLILSVEDVEDVDDYITEASQAEGEKCIIMGLKCLWFLILLICITFLCLGLILLAVCVTHRKAKMGSHSIKQSDEYLEQTASTRKRSRLGSSRSYSVSYRNSHSNRESSSVA